MSEHIYKKLRIPAILLLLVLLLPCVVRATDQGSVIVSEDGTAFIEADGNRYCYAKTVSEAADYVRSQLEEKQDPIRCACLAQGEKKGEDLWDAIEEAIYSEAETDADYLDLSMSGYDVEISYTSEGIYFFEVKPYYYTTADQDKKLEEEIGKLSLTGKNDYETARNIYRYICSKISYDDDNDSLSFTAFGALMNKKAVCQGFTLLYYLMGQKCGLDVGIVTGNGKDSMSDGWGIHAWNVVKLDGKYYYLDTTWDSEADSYSYFLKGSKTFEADHETDSHNSYSVSSSNYNIPLADRKLYDASYQFPVSSIKLYGSGISGKIAAGKTILLKAKIAPDYAANKKLSWKSSNKKVATANQSGKVSIKKKTGGKKVTITATAKDGSGKKAVWKIKVMKGAVKKISIKGKKSLKAGNALKLKAKVKAGRGANKKLSWESSNTKYATVSSAGKVKAKKAGKGKTVTITARATDGSKKKGSIRIKIK